MDGEGRIERDRFRGVGGAPRRRGIPADRGGGGQADVIGHGADPGSDLRAGDGAETLHGAEAHQLPGGLPLECHAGLRRELTRPVGRLPETESLVKPALGLGGERWFAARADRERQSAQAGAGLGAQPGAESQPSGVWAVGWQAPWRVDRLHDGELDVQLAAGRPLAEHPARRDPSQRSGVLQLDRELRAVGVAEIRTARRRFPEVEVVVVGDHVNAGAVRGYGYGDRREGVQRQCEESSRMQCVLPEKGAERALLPHFAATTRFSSLSGTWITLRIVPPFT